MLSIWPRLMRGCVRRLYESRHTCVCGWQGLGSISFGGRETRPAFSFRNVSRCYLGFKLLLVTRVSLCNNETGNNVGYDYIIINKNKSNQNSNNTGSNNDTDNDNIINILILVAILIKKIVMMLMKKYMLFIMMMMMIISRMTMEIVISKVDT